MYVFVTVSVEFEAANEDVSQNWSSGKKSTLTIAIMLSGFATAMQSVTNVSGYAPQAALYGESVVNLTYSVGLLPLRGGSILT